MMVERITSKHNPLIVHVRKLFASRSYRYRCGEFAADGTKLLAEAAQWCEGLRTVILQEGIVCPAVKDGVRVVEVPQPLMRVISPMEAPQGAVFVCAIPEQGKAQISQGTLILDGIQDPGNMGTILRTADALGVPVVLTEGCVDPYNDKTVRASMGAIFRTPPVCMPHGQVLEACKRGGVRMVATAMSQDAVDLRAAALHEAAVVIGSEGQGVSQTLLRAAEEHVIIPMQPQCESLNAAIAAAIVMWEMQR